MTASSPEGGSDKLTLIVVPDETARVRRVQISKSWIRHAAYGAALVVVVAGAGFADWVRLRIDAVDIDLMREQTAADERRLVELAGELAALEQRLEGLREFERKVRLIADLPSAIPEVGTSAAVGGDEGAGRREGEGDLRAGEVPGEEVPGGEVRAEGAPGPAVPTALAPSPRGLGLDQAALARISRKAARLSGRADQRGHSYEELFGQLDGKSKRLASTPSIWPTDGWVTSSFGNRISPFTGRRQFHSGLDIAADFGTPILAPARGRVSFVGRKGALGKTVVVDHGFGVQTTYGHASETFVRRGQEVDRGQRLASVGSTGRSTGPHLHYAVKARGDLVNPADYILD
jgi:murein DD-endopeptidase MepM/ murein hydrolase activator NlpD